MTCILNINIFRTLKLPFLLSYHYSHSFLSFLQKFLHQSIFSMLLSLLNSSNTPLHFSNAFPGTVCVLVFQIFLSFPKDYKSINKAADPCFLQISIKMAPYFQQKLYHIDSWIQTCLLSPKTTGSSSSVLSYRQLTSSLVLASDLIAQIPWDNDLKLFITRWKMLLSLQYKYISSSSCSLSAADTKYSSNGKFSPFFPLFQIIFKLLAASKMS